MRQPQIKITPAVAEAQLREIEDLADAMCTDTEPTLEDLARIRTLARELGEREQLRSLVWADDGAAKPAVDVLVVVECWLTQRTGALAESVRGAMSTLHGRHLMAWLRDVSL